MSSFERDPVSGRYITDCALCGQSDTHPKHSVQMAKQVSRFHFDCHAPVGCADCARSLVEHDKAHGEALISSLAGAREANDNG